MVGPNSFVFLNEAGALDRRRPGGGWDDPQRSKLWRYNLDYFDDLNAENAQTRREWHSALLAGWLEHNPPGRGTGWEPYPTALRIVNWIKAVQDGFVLSPDALHNLAVQTRWLSRRIEHHLSGNHLIANAKALCFAGAFFEGSEAGAWFERGWRILARELPEQILADGGHYELSPMYHSLVLEDLLDLLAIAQRFGVGAHLRSLIEARIAPMRQWLSTLRHPDGEIGFFNDAALGVAPTPAALEAYAQRSGLGSIAPPADGLLHLQDSGYLRWARDGAVLLIDVAQVGPDHQPGHAHADTLCFELSLGGQRVLVNSGTSEYGTSPERLRQRGTAAHNTLTIDDSNSSEVWSGFRVGRRARPQDLRIEASVDRLTISAGHNGYRHLPDRPVHQRTWRLDGNELTIVDEVSGPVRFAEAHYHFAPGLQLAVDGTRGWAECCARIVLQWRVLEGTARILSDTHHPRFGVTLPSQRLILSCDNNYAALLVKLTERIT